MAAGHKISTHSSSSYPTVQIRHLPTGHGAQTLLLTGWSDPAAKTRVVLIRRNCKRARCTISYTSNSRSVSSQQRSPGSSRRPEDQCTHPGTWRHLDASTVILPISSRTSKELVPAEVLTPCLRAHLTVVGSRTMTASHKSAVPASTPG